MSSNARTSDVVVSGLGCVLAGGCGADHLARALATGDAPTAEMEVIPGLHPRGGPRSAVTAGHVDLSPWLSPLAARRMGRPSRMAVAAMFMALEEAGLKDAPTGVETGVVMATSYGPADFSEQILVQILDEGPQAVSPFLFTESVANAPAAQMAIHARATAANITVTQREAGPLIALSLARREIEWGRAERILVGAVDEINPLLHGALARFGALAEADEQGVERARPFDRERDGYLGGEGAVVLVLEREAAVRERGAAPLARVSGGASAFDSSAPAADWGGGDEVLSLALRQALERGQVDLESFDAIVSGACGARGLDRLEGRTLRGVWEGTRLPPVVTPKAVTGETGGALLAAPILLLAGNTPGGPSGFRHPDPEIGVSPHDGQTLDRAERVLVSGLACGGAAAWAWLEAVA